MTELKCPWADCAMLQKLKNDLASLKVDCRSAEERRDNYVKTAQSELAEIANATLVHYRKEINLTRKQIASLESRFSGKKDRLSL